MSGKLEQKEERCCQHIILSRLFSHSHCYSQSSPNVFLPIASRTCILRCTSGLDHALMIHDETAAASRYVLKAGYNVPRVSCVTWHLHQTLPIAQAASFTAKILLYSRTRHSVVVTVRLSRITLNDCLPLTDSRVTAVAQARYRAKRKAYVHQVYNPSPSSSFTLTYISSVHCSWREQSPYYGLKHPLLRGKNWTINVVNVLWKRRSPT